MKRVWLASVALLLVAAACGSGEAGSAADTDHAGHVEETNEDAHGEHGGHGSNPEEGSIPGSPASPSEADREVEVIASDDLSFSPPSIDVAAGEVVTFVIHNEGQIQHEFVLGDEVYQAAHEEDMAGGGHHMGALDNAVSLGPGETGEITWRFEAAGEVLYGCHEPGHYDGGMVGTIEVI